MRKLSTIALGLALAAVPRADVQAQQEPAGKTLAATLGVYAFPTEGQSPEVQSTDEAKCYAWAVETTGIDPFELQKQHEAAMQQAAAQQQAAKQAGKGARAKGALAGAATGALIGEIADDDAGKGAAIGATTGLIAGGASRRKAQRQAEAQAQATAASATELTEKQMEDFRKAFGVCLEANKYLVKY